MNLLPVYDLLPVRSAVPNWDCIPSNPPAAVLLSSQWAAAAVPGAVVLPEAQEPWSDIPAEAVPGVLPAGEPVLQREWPSSPGS